MYTNSIPGNHDCTHMDLEEKPRSSYGPHDAWLHLKPNRPQLLGVDKSLIVSHYYSRYDQIDDFV